MVVKKSASRVDFCLSLRGEVGVKTASGRWRPLPPVAEIAELASQDRARSTRSATRCYFRLDLIDAPRIAL